MTQIKNAEQIEGIRKSCSLLGDTFRMLKGLVKLGAIPTEIDAAAKEYIESRGGRPSFLGYNGYPASLCVSVNEVVIHGIPDNRPLQEGDIVGIDCGINLNGYFSDSAFTFPIGNIGPEKQKLVTISRESLYLGIEAARPGNRVKDISRAVYRHLMPNGYGIVRTFCGHGVGLAIHEDPQVPNYPSGGPNPRLKPGMVLAIEPMVNLGTEEVKVLADDWTVITRDKSVSAHFEHTVLITETGPEILTAWD